MSNAPKNLIIICSDEMRGDCLGTTGLNPDIRTPNMDALAKRGVNFSRHFTTCPKCVPSRISMMTGRYPHTDGYRNIFQHLPADQPDMASQLKGAGYETALFGKNHCWENLLEASQKPSQLAEGQKGMAFDHHSWTGHYGDIYSQGSKQAEQERAASKTPMGKSTLDDFESPGTYRGDMRGWDDEVYAEQAIDFLTQTRDRKRPFFMQLNLEKPHTPYNVEEPYFSMYDRDAIEAYPSSLPKNASLTYREQQKVRNEGIDEAGLREIQATYYGMVSKVDHLVGQVVAAIEAQGLFEDTVVMLWSDHGDYAGQYGLPEKWDTGFSDCLTHSVLVMAAPGLPSGKRVESLSDNTDIVPTLCELLEVSPPPGLHGGSLVPVAQGQGGANDGRAAVFSEGGHEAEMRGRFSFPDATNGKQKTYRDCPDTMARARMVRTATHKLVIRETGGDELYDLEEDRWEMNNRWDDPALAAVKTDLLTKLAKWALTTDTDRPYQAEVGA